MDAVELNADAAASVVLASRMLRRLSAEFFELELSLSSLFDIRGLPVVTLHHGLEPSPGAAFDGAGNIIAVQMPGTVGGALPRIPARGER
jgi:hypothetical protein